MHILGVVTVPLDEFETAPLPVTVRRAWRIARLRGNVFEALRFAMELGADAQFGALEPSLEISKLRMLAQVSRQGCWDWPASNR